MSRNAVLIPIAGGYFTNAPAVVASRLVAAGIAQLSWPVTGEKIALLTDDAQRIVVRDDGLLVCPPALHDAVLAVLLPKSAMTKKRKAPNH